MIKKILKYIPGIGKLVHSNEFLAAQLKQFQTLYPPGHYYSSVHSMEALKDYRMPPVTELPGAVNMNISRQEQWLDAFIADADKLVFPATQQPGYRYYYENDFFGYNDGIICQLLIHQLKPKRIIEVGSGFSSALMLDMNDKFFNNSIDLKFIEPYPERLNSLLKPGEKIELFETTIQNVDLKLFEQLEENDILFIDSTHVSKFNSDVNKLFFEIFPILKKGVYIHIHDIHWQFEYNLKWLQEGRAWNEAYLLRAFLQYNNTFTIQYFNAFAELKFSDKYAASLPDLLKTKGGSIWIKKEM